MENTKSVFLVNDSAIYQLDQDDCRIRIFATVQGCKDVPKEELEATARLFAAAPDMLEALKGMVVYYGYAEFGPIEAARKAIAKAQGEM